MVGIYFSGTGNTKYCVKNFLDKYDKNAKMYSIEDSISIEKIKENDEILFAYPIQFSNIPKFVKDFIKNNSNIWKNKRIFILATMGLFSGDGTGLSKRLFVKYGAKIVGGLHLQMPDSICDTKALKRTLQKNKEIIHNSLLKIEKAATRLKNNKPTKKGLNFFYHLAGLFGQRLYFPNKTKNYSNKLKIDSQKCVGCKLCENNCPMKNIVVENGKAKAKDTCTMCYRCISHCPKQAITLLGNKIIEQTGIEKYL